MLELIYPASPAPLLKGAKHAKAAEMVPVIGSEDLDTDFNQPIPGAPEDAF